MTAPTCAGCGEPVTTPAALSYGQIIGVYRCGGGYCSKNTAFIHRGVYRAPGSLLERTTAEKYVIDELGGFLSGDQPYRVGFLLLSYADPGDGQSRIAGGLAMNEVNVGSAIDLVMMIKRLRGLADELDGIVAGRRPLPVQGGGDG